MNTFLIIILCIVLSFSVISCGGNSDNNESTTISDENLLNDDDNKDFAFIEPEKSEAFEALDTKMIDSLMELGFTNEESCEIQGILNSVGINSISEIQLGYGEGIDNLQSFVCIANDNKDLKFFFTVENRKLFYAGFAGEDLYDSEQGGALKLIQDVDIPEREISTSMQLALMDTAKSAAENYLNYPSTAKFDLGSWRFSRWNDKYNVYFEVEAQNAFGVPDTVVFNMEITDSNGVLVVTGVEII